MFKWCVFYTFEDSIQPYIVVYRPDVRNGIESQILPVYPQLYQFKPGTFLLFISAICFVVLHKPFSITMITFFTSNWYTLQFCNYFTVHIKTIKNFSCSYFKNHIKLQNCKVYQFIVRKFLIVPADGLCKKPKYVTPINNNKNIVR